MHPQGGWAIIVFICDWPLRCWWRICKLAPLGGCAPCGYSDNQGACCHAWLVHRKEGCGEAAQSWETLSQLGLCPVAEMHTLLLITVHFRHTRYTTAREKPRSSSPREVERNYFQDWTGNKHPVGHTEENLPRNTIVEDYLKKKIRLGASMDCKTNSNSLHLGLSGPSEGHN